MRIFFRAKRGEICLPFRAKRGENLFYKNSKPKRRSKSVDSLLRFLLRRSLFRLRAKFSKKAGGGEDAEAGQDKILTNLRQKLGKIFLRISRETKKNHRALRGKKNLDFRD